MILSRISAYKTMECPISGETQSLIFTEYIHWVHSILANFECLIKNEVVLAMTSLGITANDRQRV